MKAKVCNMKSKLQKWVWKRCFHNKGSLTGIAIRLRKIAACQSTLLSESKVLTSAAIRIEALTALWNDKEVKQESWLKFKK